MHEQVAKDCYARPAPPPQTVALHPGTVLGRAVNDDGLKMLRHPPDPNKYETDDQAWLYPRAMTSAHLAQQLQAHTGPSPFAREYMGEWRRDPVFERAEIERDRERVRQQLDALQKTPPRPFSARMGIDVGADAPEYLRAMAQRVNEQNEQMAVKNAGSGSVSVHLRHGTVKLQPGESVEFQRAALTGDVTGRGGSTAPIPITKENFSRLDVGDRVTLGRCATGYDPQLRSVSVYTTATVDELERLRGLAPREIFLRGVPADYSVEVRAAIKAVIFPMLVDGAALDTPEAKHSEWIATEW